MAEYRSKYTGAEVDALLDKIAEDNVGDIDSALSIESENPVMNKILTARFNGIDTRIDSLPTKLSQFEDDVVAGKYLPLSGGTIRGGVLEIDSSLEAYSFLRFKDRRINSAGYVDSILKIIDADGNAHGAFGLYGNSDGVLYYYLGCENDSYNGNNLRIYADKVSFGGSTILHSGNVGSYALKVDGSNKMGVSAYINWATNEGREDYSAYNDGIRLLGYNSSTGDYTGGIHIGTRYGWQLVRDGYTDTMKIRYRNVGTTTWEDWKTIAFTDSNVASATRARYVETQKYTGADWYGDSYKLYAKWFNGTICDWKSADDANNEYKVRVDIAKKLDTARTIWGQSFDGTGNVDGILYMGGSDVLSKKTNALYIGYGSAITDALPTYLWGDSTYFLDKGGKTKMLINSSGNVTIGGSDLAGMTYKMSVDGKVHIRSTEGAAMTEGAGSLIVGNGEVLMIDANDIQAKTSGTTTGPLYINDWGGSVVLCGQNNGNVLIGTTADSGYKLNVNGDTHISGNLIVDGTITPSTASASYSLRGGTSNKTVVIIDVGSTEETIEHGLGADVTVSLYARDTIKEDSWVLTSNGDIEITDTSVIVTFDNPTLVEYKVVIVG